MADKITFELVSPERLLLSVEADMVTVPGSEGDFGVLPGHAPLISSLRPGVIEVEGAADWDDRIFVAGGVAEVAADRLTVLAEEAVPVRDLDRAAIQQRLQNAREDLEDATDDEARRKAGAMIAHLEDLARAVGG
jgi:F-type H+-transporting ATPase subunit epsilon